MTTISLTYNERNALAAKTIKYILSLGVFKAEENISPARKKTLMAIQEAKERRNTTTCNSFEEYLKAVEK